MGFTLLELLMVVVIIGVLMGILMPVVGILKQSALRKQIEAEARTIETAIRNYHSEKGVWPGDGQGVYAADAKQAALIEALWQTTPPLLDSNNMVKPGIYYIQPGTTNSPWRIVISNRTVTVQ